MNPADIGGGAAPLDDYFLQEVEKVVPPVSTQWLTFPHLYTGACESRDGATWLQVTDVAARPQQTPGRLRVEGAGLGVPSRRRQPRARQPGARRGLRRGGVGEGVALITLRRAHGEARLHRWLR